MSKPRKRRKPRGQQQGIAVTELQKESIVQTYAITNSYTETARLLGLHVGTVTKYVKLVPPAELARRRADTQRQLAGKFHEKTLQILESIDGEKLAKSSLGQLSMSAGIFADKVVNLDRSAHEMTQQDSEKSAFTPGTAQELLQAILQKANALSINIDINKANPDLPAKLDAAALAEVEIVEFDDVVVKSEDELYGFDADAAKSPRSVEST